MIWTLEIAFTGLKLHRLSTEDYKCEALLFVIYGMRQKSLKVYLPQWVLKFVFISSVMNKFNSIAAIQTMKEIRSTGTSIHSPIL
mmetsp:Transcript_19040/g.31857  ORF Transcript_19040/g.31857 Transcript_19040/m.31857 type:complete len:85 (-) Transcript_19040:1004-1258(-)